MIFAARNLLFYGEFPIFISYNTPFSKAFPITPKSRRFGTIVAGRGWSCHFLCEQMSRVTKSCYWDATSFSGLKSLEDQSWWLTLTFFWREQKKTFRQLGLKENCDFGPGHEMMPLKRSTCLNPCVLPWNDPSEEAAKICAKHLGEMQKEAAGWCPEGGVTEM
jgi:hypothetical protein